MYQFRCLTIIPIAETFIILVFVTFPSSRFVTMRTIVIDRQLAHQIVIAFRNVYLRSVIPQLGQTCMIRVIDFIGNVQEAKLT